MLISKGVQLFPWYGATEVGPPTRLFDVDASDHPPPDAKTWDDWEWMSFSPRVYPNWVSQGDGYHELQLLVSSLNHLLCFEI